MIFTLHPLFCCVIYIFFYVFVCCFVVVVVLQREGKGRCSQCSFITIYKRHTSNRNWYSTAGNQSLQGQINRDENMIE